MAQGSLAKRWVFTYNNYTLEIESLIKGLDCAYCCYGREVGESGTPHLQGCICFNTQKRLTACKKILPSAHWEIMRGNIVEASDYCKKDGEFEEFGLMPEIDNGANEKKRWSDAIAACKAGNLDDVPDDIRLKYYRTCKEIAKDFMVKAVDCDGVTGVWIYGPSGTGKSRLARQDYPDSYLKMQNKWWDGYQGEDSVILDDFDCKELGHLLKIWADRYSFVAETKGGAINIRPKKFVITSNYSIDDLFPDGELNAAIKRRFRVIHISVNHPFSV